MKCFTLITLVAGLTVTGCAFGMDEAQEALIDTLATDILSKFSPKKQNATASAKKALAHTNGVKGKLNVIRQMLKNGAFTDQANITSYTNRIDTLSNYTPSSTPIKTAPANPPSSQAQTTPQPGPAETPATHTADADTEIKPIPATSLLRNPLFIGVFVLSSLAAITYIYVQKQKTKKAEAIDNENESDQARA